MEDRYEIREKIGQGGIGSVHRAYDQKMGRHVAIKRILSSGEGSSQEAEATKQMMAEVSALASLQHPHIVTVFDVGEDEQGPFVVMELIDGKTLDEIVANAPLTWQDFKQVAMQSLEALIAAHDLEMIHSDLKPPNIMLTWMPSGAFQVKIVDFGLATMIHSQSQEEIKKMGSVYGSVFFMPPEQFEGKVLDPRSDLYSLGCCFYQALAGTAPFNGDTGLQVMQAHLEHLVTPIQEIRDDIPKWACDWVMWLIHRDQNDRPASSREALADFLRNDKKAEAASREAAASGGKPRLITSNTPPKSETGAFATAAKTTAIHAIAPPGSAPSPDTTAVGHTAAVYTKPPASGLPKDQLIKIGIPAVAAVLILIFIISMAMKRNERVRANNAYQSIIAMAAVPNVRQIHIGDAQLELLFDFISTSDPGGNLTLAYEALTKATSTGGTDIDAAILAFATTPDLPGQIRRGLFEEVIANRKHAETVPGVLNYIESATDADEATAAFEAILPMIREEHAKGLLDVITHTGHAKIRDAAAAELSQIIASSRNRDDLAGLITEAHELTDTPDVRSHLDQLLTESKPREQTQARPQQQSQAPGQERQQLRRSLNANDTEQLERILGEFEASDEAGKRAILTTLSENFNNVNFVALTEILEVGEHLRIETTQALIDHNTLPDSITEERMLQRRWNRIIWRCELPEQQMMVIDALAEIGDEWSIARIGQIGRSGGSDLAIHAGKVLEKLKEGNE